MDNISIEDLYGPLNEYLTGLDEIIPNSKDSIRIMTEYKLKLLEIRYDQVRQEFVDKKDWEGYPLVIALQSLIASKKRKLERLKNFKE